MTDAQQAATSKTIFTVDAIQTIHNLKFLLHQAILYRAKEAVETDSSHLVTAEDILKALPAAIRDLVEHVGELESTP